MVIFKAVGEGRPYPDHGFNTPKQWASLPPRPVRLDELVTTKRTLDLEALLAEDSTFFGDLFPHVVQYQGTMYLEDGLHRALRAQRMRASCVAFLRNKTLLKKALSETRAHQQPSWCAACRAHVGVRTRRNAWSGSG